MTSVPSPNPSPNGRVDLAQAFAKLTRDPIVESMIVFSGRAKAEWEPQTTGKRIHDSLPDYPTSQHVNFARFKFEMATSPTDGTAPPPSSTATAENLGWMGLRLTSIDQKRVVTVGRDSLALSRLAPYEGWASLSTEMMRLWQLHKEIAGVDSLDSIQVRYINRIEVPAQDFDPAQYFTGFGAAAEGFFRGPFIHQDTLFHAEFPRHLLNVTRTFELPASQGLTIPLILVLEGICAEPIPAEIAMIEQRLAELHWLKNHAFFHSVTSSLLDLCR